MKQIIIVILTIISLNAFSQKDRLSWGEKYRLAYQNGNDSIDWNYSSKIIDSLIQGFANRTFEDYFKDSSEFIEIISDTSKFDSIQFKTIDIFFSRGGSMMELGNDSTLPRKREREI